jgi:uncharacterized protein YyaL (SSP411 family)
MLYDNAQLARVYLHAWQVTGSQFFRTITEEILDYVIREMLDPAGGFYSTQDAESEGEEGKFFVWTPAEIREILRDVADEFMAAYGVTQHGNFEGKNILEFAGDMNQRATVTEARPSLRLPQLQLPSTSYGARSAAGAGGVTLNLCRGV